MVITSPNNNGKLSNKMWKALTCSRPPVPRLASLTGWPGQSQIKSLATSQMWETSDCVIYLRLQTDAISSHHNPTVSSDDHNINVNTETVLTISCY